MTRRYRKARCMIRLALTLMLALLASQGVNAASNDKATSIVLVHGAFVDGSGWKAVFDLLSQDGYEVLVVQHTTSTLEGDAAAVTSVIDSAKFPVVLVGHSYGGMVISEAGISPKVKSLVYVAAYAPESGESVAKLAQLPAQPGESRAPLLPARDGHRTRRSREISCRVRGRRAPVDDALHGGLATALGPRRRAGRGPRSRVEGEADVVPGHDKGPHDPAERAANDGEAQWRQDHRSR